MRAGIVLVRVGTTTILASTLALVKKHFNKYLLCFFLFLLLPSAADLSSAELELEELDELPCASDCFGTFLEESCVECPTNIHFFSITGRESSSGINSRTMCK